MKLNKCFMSSRLHVAQPTNFHRFQNARFLASKSEEPPKPYSTIPGLSSIPILGSLHHFLPLIGNVGVQPNFFDMTDQMYKKFGSIVKLEGVMARANMVILYDPEHFDQVYRAEEAAVLRPGFDTLIYYRTELRKSTFDGVYGLTTAYVDAKKIWGLPPPLTMQGAQWRDFRSKVNPALLKPKLVKLYEPALEDIAEEMVSRFRKLKDDGNYLQTKLDLEMMKWSLESVALVGLGCRIGCMREDLPEDHPALQLMKSAEDILKLSFKLEFLPSLWRYIATPNFRKIIKAFDTQWDISAKYIDIAKNQITERGCDVPEEDKSIIEKLLAIDEKVAVMMANEMLMAGIGTVSFATISLLYHLAANPATQEKLRQEIRSGTSKKSYLRACLKESFRLCPVVPANLRRTTRKHIVGGYLIPEGIDVVAPNEYISRLEKYYPQPTEFLPERWVVEKTDPLYYGNAHPMTTLPFGFGVRTCIGRRIAELEIETLIKKLIENFKVSWKGPPIKIVTKVTNNFVKPYYFKFDSVK